MGNPCRWTCGTRSEYQSAHPPSTSAALSCPCADRGGDDYERVRPLAYPMTNIFLICFEVAVPSSRSRAHVTSSTDFRRKQVEEKWWPEIQRAWDSWDCVPDGGVHICICGTKTDLRHPSLPPSETPGRLKEWGDALARRMMEHPHVRTARCAR